MSQFLCFFNDFLNFVCNAAELSPDTTTDVAGFTGEIVLQAIMKVDSGISRIFLNALCLNFPRILPSDGDRLVSALLVRYEIAVPNSVRERISNTPDAVSAQSSSLNVNNYQPPGNEASIASAGSANNGGSITWKSSVDLLDGSIVFNDRGEKKDLTSIQEDSVEILQRQELVFKLIGHILDKVAIDPKLLEQIRVLVKEQLQSMRAFLKIKKRDWTEQGQLLKDKINIKLSVYQASARLLIKTLASLDTESKSSKRLWLGALALLIEAAEACLFSVWRKLSACEELFGSLLVGISQASVTRGGQLLRLLLIHFKRPRTCYLRSGTFLLVLSVAEIKHL
ncbi:phosphatidylinositol 4-kinase alpha 1 isoform X1 [Olea europaea subsp. europaea]|uniref:Phosphatidylinositol 4-kinase alpha 1 isoform X1 n=1 Tax=Olea europaea subsp. europaea TaxID=158383 RepID=A0A8S0T573_OLEEU|nr:phosphatidylinositol 4-kinase alpha 1 isoform X1 [Olea europaea subsp. europaea]